MLNIFNYHIYQQYILGTGNERFMLWLLSKNVLFSFKSALETPLYMWFILKIDKEKGQNYNMGRSLNNTYYFQTMQ
jgi:hypothetical protein